MGKVDEIVCLELILGNGMLLNRYFRSREIFIFMRYEFLKNTYENMLKRLVFEENCFYGDKQKKNTYKTEELSFFNPFIFVET